MMNRIDYINEFLEIPKSVEDIKTYAMNEFNWTESTFLQHFKIWVSDGIIISVVKTFDRHANKRPVYLYERRKLN